MSLTPYDWNQSIQTRTEYVEERLRDGSPVVGLSLQEGVLLLSVHRAHRKLFEIYDRLVFAGIGNQSDVETMRAAAIDFAHREGFTRSPDDVTAQRLVGSVLSPALKKAFGDPFTAPFVFRGIFAELGAAPAEDRFFALGFDGEYRAEDRYAALAGIPEAENAMLAALVAASAWERPLEDALEPAIQAWAAGRRESLRRTGPTAGEDAGEEAGDLPTVADLLRDELAAGTLEAALLERHVARESRFRLLSAAELAPAAAPYR